MASPPLLPPLLVYNGLTYIPPPSTEDFEKEFPDVMPKGVSLESSWGVTRYYDFKPEAPSARRVLLIHGAGTSAIGLAPLAQKLVQAGNHVVTYDLWGHGNSSTPLAAHTPALAHAQILELLSHLKWTTCHFVGYSLGGAILASFAATHPTVALSVTIVAGAGLFSSSGPSGKLTDDEALGFLRAGEPKEGWRERLKLGVVEPEPVQLWERENHKGYERSLHAAYGKVFENKTKVLEILGEKDQAIKAEETKTELLTLGWNEADIKVVAGATHEIVRSHAQEVASLMLDFWGR